MNEKIFYCNKFASDKKEAKKLFSILKVSKGPVYLFKKKGNGEIVISHKNKLIEGKKFVFMPQNFEAIRVEDHIDLSKGPVDIIHDLKTGQEKEIIRHKHLS